jgi:hypothetical protein
VPDFPTFNVAVRHASAHPQDRYVKTSLGLGQGSTYSGCNSVPLAAVASGEARADSATSKVQACSTHATHHRYSFLIFSVAFIKANAF